ncbi:MAG: hypothetical protein V7651_17110 [Hyphomonas oceanitis]|uniref:hypothetical protein n=1 Tax=Hyphomonas oceanitis TaxID=81033 RepID=UPI0030024940
MAASRARTGKVRRYLVKMHVPMVDLQQKLRRTLQPCVQAPYASRLQRLALIEILEAHIA